MIPDSQYKIWPKVPRGCRPCYRFQLPREEVREMSVIVMSRIKKKKLSKFHKVLIHYIMPIHFYTNKDNDITGIKSWQEGGLMNKSLLCNFVIISSMYCISGWSINGPLFKLLYIFLCTLYIMLKIHTVLPFR